MIAKEGTKELSAVADKYRKYVNPSLARLLKFSGYYALEHKSEGVYIYDEDGNEYLDCAGGYGVFVVGHRHPEVLKAVRTQLDLMPLSSKVFFNKPLAELAEKLSLLTGGALQYSFFCNSGAEAIEGAIKIARMHTGKPQIISAVNSYHGKTIGALSISGREIYRQPFEPLMPETVRISFDDVDALKGSFNDNTAAVVLEPIQGEGGIIVPSHNYIAAVRELCDRAGVLFIADEIQTGMGRTGRFFAVEHWGVWPDIITLAKGLGGGVMPIGAIMGNSKVWDVFSANPLIHTSTFGGNQLACAAGLATIEVLEKDNLLQKCKERGDYFIGQLMLLKDEYPDIIGDIRGRGLMIGVELIKERFGGSIIFEMARGRVTGVYTLNNQKVIRFEPPLTITEQQIDFAIGVFKGALKKTREMFSQ